MDRLRGGRSQVESHARKLLIDSTVYSRLTSYAECKLMRGERIILGTTERIQKYVKGAGPEFLIQNEIFLLFKVGLTLGPHLGDLLAEYLTNSAREHAEICRDCNSAIARPPNPFNFLCEQCEAKTHTLCEELDEMINEDEDEDEDA